VARARRRVFWLAYDTLKLNGPIPVVNGEARRWWRRSSAGGTSRYACGKEPWVTRGLAACQDQDGAKGTREKILEQASTYT